ncbi:TonB family protein [Erwinia sp. P6884]|uniref:TonB family protein n=1 Tax=Erwinia sp. P6884 TaxID=3141450 RepID=UPI0031925E46
MVKLIFLTATLVLTACTAPPQKVEGGTEPKALMKAPPIYPLYAWNNGLSGYIKFEYDIGADGKVSEIRILDSKPRYLFDDAIVKAVSTWRFEKGHAYSNIQQTVRFRLRNPDSIL